MERGEPRGIAVVDIGATNVKAMLFDAALNPLAERKVASGHAEGPPYRHLLPEPALALFAEALPAFDAILPVDTIVPTAHGAALACLDAQGDLALPPIDYTAEPPPEITAAYRELAPPFTEVYCPVLPLALTHALQLFWQEKAFADDFARVRTIMPWIQYFAYRLSGVAVSEVASMSCQSQLIDVRDNGPSSLARARGWDKRFAPRVEAWRAIGALKPEFRGNGMRGRAEVLAGVHDSSGNYLRYRAGGLGRFTLLSTGTWIIGFDTDTPINRLKPEVDTVTNTDIFGRPVACCRFFGGREFEVLSRDAPAAAASVAVARRLVVEGTLALPSFTNSGGPMPGTANRGRIEGPAPRTPEEFASLASLYCALMCDRSLAAIGSAGDIIVDGPFSTNAVFLSALAALRPKQKVFASALRDGTAQGTAVLALMSSTGELPRIELDLVPAPAMTGSDLQAYRALWLARDRRRDVRP
jgi:sugar (pentulose or hexulose) kinase